MDLQNNVHKVIKDLSLVLLIEVNMLKIEKEHFKMSLIELNNILTNSLSIDVVVAFVIFCNKLY